MTSAINWNEIEAGAKIRTKPEIRKDMRDRLRAIGPELMVSDLLSSPVNIRPLVYQVAMGYLDERTQVDTHSVVAGRRYKLKVLSAEALWKKNDDGAWGRCHEGDGHTIPGGTVRWKIDQITHDEYGKLLTGQRKDEMIARGEEIYTYAEFMVAPDGTIEVPFERAWEMLLTHGRRFAFPAFHTPKKGEKDSEGNDARRIVNHWFDEVPNKGLPATNSANGQEVKRR